MMHRIVEIDRFNSNVIVLCCFAFYCLQRPDTHRVDSTIFQIYVSFQWHLNLSLLSRRPKDNEVSNSGFCRLTAVI